MLAIFGTLIMGTIFTAAGAGLCLRMPWRPRPKSSAERRRQGWFPSPGHRTPPRRGAAQIDEERFVELVERITDDGDRNKLGGFSPGKCQRSAGRQVVDA